MALADRIAEGPRRLPKGPACNTGRLLAGLPKKDAEALRMILEDPVWTVSQILSLLAEEGYRIGRHTLTRHRDGVCTCSERGLR